MTKTFFNAYIEERNAYFRAKGWQNCDQGTNAAICAYFQTNERGLDAFAVKDMPASGDMDAFMDCLAEAGIGEFLLCDKSSGLMEALHYLLAQGWQVCGTYEKQDRYSPLLGLRLRKAVA
jgi:hypothetical protein